MRSWSTYLRERWRQRCKSCRRRSDEERSWVDSETLDADRWNLPSSKLRTRLLTSPMPLVTCCCSPFTSTFAHDDKRSPETGMGVRGLRPVIHDGKHRPA